MSAKPGTIIYTITDEAPALATRSLLPVIEAFAGVAGVSVETRDISLAARVLATFPEALNDQQRISDDLAELGALVKEPEANVIKLPNISASVPQLNSTIEELRSKGYDVPLYPEEPSTPEEESTKARYDAVKGSAVNPVLREGNSDRRAPGSVKSYARSHPHSMGEWSAESATDVATMGEADFRSNEQSVTIDSDTDLRIELVTALGTTVLKESVPVLAGEVVDGSYMSASALRNFLGDQVKAAKDGGVLLSVHLKATMMKVSDPIIFGHAVLAYFGDVFEEHAATFERLGIDPTNGIGDLEAKIADLPEAERSPIEESIAAALESGPALAMVDSDRGITNLHVPSDVIIDASMPAMIRTSGQMWNPAGEQQDTLAVIPDSSYAGVYQAVIDDCRANGAYDPTTMGSVPNVGLMAQKAEEYGSHDKTFEIAEAGTVQVVDSNGDTLIEHEVETGDIWRACQTKDAPIRDWVRLAVSRARATGAPAVFWLDETRAHDAQLLAKVRKYLGELDTDGLQIEIMAPVQATEFSLERIRRGEDTISVTGNVLRDYLTDLFPILELGTSAKMLSVVPLMAGGGLFETGAGGSAPKHVQQLVAENHLRWDSLGEFLALAASLEHLADTFDNPTARILGDTLDAATGRLLEEGRSPSRKVNELDNRGSHFYLAMYWARAMADQGDDAALAAKFGPVAAALEESEDTIVEELTSVQGAPVDLDGYYFPDPDRATEAMRPSEAFNSVVDGIG
ncbi:MAG: NADP-dependent isocitrate dehydrogenase [Microthrixaceae bacterium]